MSKIPAVLFLSGFAVGIIPVIPNIPNIPNIEARREKSPDTDSSVSAKLKTTAPALVRSDREATKKAPSIDNLKSFLDEYGALSPQKAGASLRQLVDADGSELNSFDITSLLARQLAKASPEKARCLLEEQKKSLIRKISPKKP